MAKRTDNTALAEGTDKLSESPSYTGAVWDNPLLTMQQLAERTGFSYTTLMTYVADTEDPLPTRQHGKQLKVLWSDFLAWQWRNFGPDGSRRGEGIKVPKGLK